MEIVDYIAFIAIGFGLGMIIGSQLNDTRYQYIVPNNVTPLCTDQLSLGWNGTQWVEGIACGDKYICVYTKDRSINETINTCAHEWAHTHEGLKD
jgi:hypothetical protein